jgi:hypothetical protein
MSIMEVLYHFAADGVLIVHLGFVLFVMAGGLLVLRWAKLAWLHVPAVVWAAFVEFTGRPCPLTPLEVVLRQQAGEAGYESDFIDHYIVSLLYPAELTRDTQTILGGVVAVVNVLIYVAVVARGRHLHSKS